MQPLETPRTWLPTTGRDAVAASASNGEWCRETYSIDCPDLYTAVGHTSVKPSEQPLDNDPTVKDDLKQQTIDWMGQWFRFDQQTTIQRQWYPSNATRPNRIKAEFRHSDSLLNFFAPIRCALIYNAC